VLIREAVEEEHFKKALIQQRKKALKSLISLEAPVVGWEEMESQIVKEALANFIPNSLS